MGVQPVGILLRLVADIDPIELAGACFVDWVITVIDVVVNTPYLMAPSYAEWWG